MEIFAGSRPQDGRTSNEDAFLIGRGEVSYAALCDGSGAASQLAKRALKVFEGLVAEGPKDALERFATWSAWTHLLDSALLGGAQSTFLAIAAFEERIMGVCVGDSRLYYLPVDGEVQILTEEASKFRLGSGKVAPYPIHQRIQRGDVLLLMSDGAWTPLGLPVLRRLWGKASTQHFSEFPAILLDEAGKFGRADDMTVVAMRV